MGCSVVRRVRRQAAAEAALQLDRSPVDGRPCFVSRLRRAGAPGAAPGFKYSTGRERNKLFVKGALY